MTKTIVLGVAVLALAACGTSAVVTNLTTDQAVVTVMGDDNAVVMATAGQACAVHKRVAVPISHVCMDIYCWQRQVLFACKAE